MLQPNTEEYGLTMSFKYANELTRNGKYKEAEAIYRNLYETTKFNIYKSALNYVEQKQDKKQTFQVNSEAISKKNRVLFITAGLKGPTAGGGIATCFHSMISTTGNDCSFETSVLYLAHPYYATGSFESWKAHYLEKCNTTLLTAVVNKKNYGSQEMQRSEAALNYLLENGHKYDTVVFHDFMGLAYYSLLAQRYNLGLQNIRIIISAHGNHTLSYYFGTKKISTWTEKVAVYMERESIRLASEITTPSDYYKDWIAEHFQQINCIKIPNIILKQDADSNTLKINFKDKSKQLLVFYGRLERLKGLDIFLNAILSIDQAKEKYNILFAGNSTKIDGKDAKEYIEEKLSESNIDFHFKFNCKAETLYKFVKDFDGVCIFPTLGETSSCVVVECILNEIRFIASDIRGIRELIIETKQSACLFKAGSIDDLSNKIAELPQALTPQALAFDMEENKSKWLKLLKSNFNNSPDKPTAPYSNELVTVIIPTSDRPKLLEKSIESIKTQTYKNIEIIVVDDASTDWATNEKITTRLGAQYIRSFSKVYKGAACNIAAKIAKGSYLCFFDDDDIAKPGMIQNYINGFDSNNSVDILSGFADYFEHDDFEKENKINLEYTSLSLGGGLEVNLHINFFGKGTFIIKTKKFLEVGGYETDSDSVPMVDYRFYIKAALNGLSIGTIPIGQYFYRKNSPNSLFYINKNKRHLQYLAKMSIESLFRKKLGDDIGKSFSGMVWNISLPSFE